MRRLPVYLLSLAAVLLIACSKMPSYVIPPDRMAEVLADMHQGEAVVESTPAAFYSDSSKQVLKQSILMRHGVTSEQFDTSLYWYGHHMENYMEMYDKVIEILQQRIADANRVGNTTVSPTIMALEGDSVDMWTGAKAMRMNGNAPSDVATFILTSDRNWEHGDLFTLNLKPVDTSSPVIANMAVEYNDGTAEYSSARVDGESVRDLKLYLDSAKTAVTLYGSIIYVPAPGETAYIDSISLIRTRNATNGPHNASGQKTVSYQ